MDGVGLVSCDVFLGGGACACVLLVGGAGSPLSEGQCSVHWSVWGVSVNSVCLWTILLALSVLLLLLLLNHFSRVRLCATHRRQPTRLPHPWDFPGKNTGVGCHFLLQCMKVKSESEVAQSSVLDTSISTAISKWPSQDIFTVTSPLLVPGIFAGASVHWSCLVLQTKAC